MSSLAIPPIMCNNAQKASEILHIGTMSNFAHSVGMKVDELKQAQFQYIRRVCDRLDKKPSALAMIAGISHSTLTRFVDKMERSEPINALGAITIKKIEDSTGIKFGAERSVQVIANVSAGGTIIPFQGFSLFQSALSLGDSKMSIGNYRQLDVPMSEVETVVAPPDARGGLCALRIEDESMRPSFKKGAVFFYSGTPQQPDKCLDELCVVQLKTGEMLIRILRQGRNYGRYDLVTITGTFMDNIEIESVAKVEHVTF